MAVIVYTIPNCPKCRAAKALLKRLGVEFEEYDVINDKVRAKEMVEKRRAVRDAGSRDVELPVLDINGKIVEGFKRAEIEEAVKGGGMV